MRWLVCALISLLLLRLAYYSSTRDLGTDFDPLYFAAKHLLAGDNPYPIASKWSSFPLFYPLPAVLLAVPFTALPVGLARVAFDIVGGGVFAYALWRYRGTYALLAVASGAYLLALKWSQTTPLLTGASLIPVLGFLLAVKPNQGLALFGARPTSQAAIGIALVLALSILVLPSWPLDWWKALHQRNEHLLSPIVQPFGWILLSAGLKWRTPEGRLLVIASLVPQNSLPYELVPLALIPGNLVEMAIFVLGSWLAVATAGSNLGLPNLVAITTATWPVMLCAVYLPMLYLVLKRPNRPKLPQSDNRLLPSDNGLQPRST